MDQRKTNSFWTTLKNKLHPPLDVDDLGKAKSIRIFNLSRPFSRSFHCSWFCFFVAFTSWFGLQPLLPTIRRELGLTKVDLANSGIASIAATIGVRVIIGPICDRFGPRITMSILLLLGAVPMALAGLIKDGTGLIILRLFIGVLGGTFVPCQFWTTAMFSGTVVGTANAFVGGWGNLGGGFTFLFMPAVFELVKLCGAHEFLAWKIAVVIPAVICMITGISIIFTSDDCPQGKWKDRWFPHMNEKLNISINIEKGNLKKVTAPLMLRQISKEKSVDEENNEEPLEHIPCQHCRDRRVSIAVLAPKTKVWTYLSVVILFIQYGCCFGVEIATNTVLNLYLLYRFKIDGCVEKDLSNSSFLYNSSNITVTANTTDSVISVPLETKNCSILDQNTASLIASLFGLMNLFARALGGVFSDNLFKYHGLPGRLLALFLCLAFEGVAMVIFSSMETISTAVSVMVFFSLFVQMSEGATYAIVPYVIPAHVGIVAGVVGAGGNTGGLIWNTIWTQLVDVDPSRWFFILGVTIIGCSLLSAFTVVQGKRIWHLGKSKCTCGTNRKE